jgi:hypothetical protein
MTYFLDDNGNQIIVNDDIQVFKSSVNLFDFTLHGNFSTSFQVPNNSFFRNSFQYFTPLQIPSNGFKATVFNMVKDGNVIERGQLVLERDDDDFLYFFFISGNSNWLNRIPDISIKDIDYDEFAISFDRTPSAYSGATSGFCFPMVEIGFNGQRNANTGGSPSFDSLVYDNSGDYLNGSINEFPPCFFIKSAMQSIFSYCELKIAGDILNDQRYLKMIITPDSGQIQRADKFYTERKVSLSPSSSSAFGKINLDTVNENGALLCWDTATQRYNANKKSLVSIKFNLNFNISLYSALKVYKNGALYLTEYLGKIGGGCGFIQNFNSTNYSNNNVPKYVTNDCFGGGTISEYKTETLIDVDTGDYLELYADFGGTYKGGVAAGGNFPLAGPNLAGDTYTVTSNGTIGPIFPGGCQITVNTGDVIQAKINSATNCATDWLYFPISGGFNVLPQSVISIEPKQILQVFPAPGTIYDTIRASDIMPDMKMIDLVKFVSQYFCAIPTYDETTSTVTFNKLDNYRYEDAKDWSQYLQKLENNFQIKTAKYNYIKFKKIEDGLVEGLRINNDLGYGDVMIQGQSSTQVTNDIFEFPFGATIDKLTTMPKRMLLPFLNLVEMEFDGNPIYINSVSNSSGVAQLNLASPINTGGSGNAQMVYIYGSLQEYNGYAETLNNTGSALTMSFPYTNNAKGFMQPLKFKYKTGQSRILWLAGDVTVSSFTDYSSINASGTTVSDFGYAYFSKPKTSLAICNVSYKQGLNLDYYSSGYNDFPVKLDCYKTLTRILNSPYAKAWMYLPDWEYTAFNFGTFIYIKDENQQRYYYVDSIENYKDSRTLCQVNLILLS